MMLSRGDAANTRIDASRGDPVLLLDAATRVVQRDISMMFTQLGRKLGVNRTQMRLLYLLAQNESMTQRELSRKLAMHDPGITLALGALEGEGYIVRLRHPHDARRIVVRLSPGMKTQMAAVASDIRETQKKAERIRSSLSQLLSRSR
ncbi:MarR family transcriptional regulator [Sphingosinicella microcystinivorans]|uniref:MarR family transcriptional regulator n=1 Tax=Sphingosinicella microcystinivorans TaxID=335406 RepID=UPI0022F3E1C6|nr:MarR family transcriptional regulator [Sphingosinicella microcystinivorans]WBX84695.1 MarR family transcriptional regulator [Sphingosinicella microcystinivorans]